VCRCTAIAFCCAVIAQGAGAPKNRKYELKQGDRPIDVGDYLKDVFSSYYGEFLLNFGSEQLMASLAD
jgi:hypothetical protein